jgi:GT2 family glycosyltransferase/glycosyltransferase involved in cell wall biosynthesis
VKDAGAIVFAGEPDPLVSVVVTAWGSSPHLFACLQALCHQRGATPYEVVLVENDVTRDVADEVVGRVRGATVIESRSNLGFAGSANVGVAASRAELVLVVHDDVEISPDCLDQLTAAAVSHPEAEVIGPAVVAAEGGSSPAPPGDAPDTGRAVGALDGSPGPGESGRADISECAFLLRRATWDRLGGLDETFYPFGFATADFCARAAETGGGGRADPAVIVRRHRSGRSSERFKSFVVALNGELFAARRSRVLRVAADRGRPAAPPAAPGPALSPQEARGRAPGGRRHLASRPRVLIIDDSVPEPSLGAGSGRMADVMGELTATGRFAVDVLPLVSRSEADPVRARALGVDVVAGDLADVVRGGRHYGVVIVSRPHNWTASIESLRALLPGVPVIYDAEALFYRRLERQIPFVVDAPTAIRVEHDAARLAEVERGIAREADHVVAISQDEAAFFQGIASTPGRVTVHHPLLSAPCPIPAPLAGRRDIGFVAGWGAGPDSPNADALDWFARKILPHIRARMPGTRLLVTGSDPPANVRRLVTPAVEFVGHVASLADFYGSVRVVVVPIRYGAGVKQKTVEAIHYGVPTVATTVGAEGVPVGRPDVLVVTDDPGEFAGHVATLLGDDVAWESQRRRVVDQSSAWAAGSVSIWPSLVEELLRDDATGESPR